MEECESWNRTVGMCDVTSCLVEPGNLIGVDQFGVSPSSAVQKIDHPQRNLE